MTRLFQGDMYTWKGLCALTRESDLISSPVAARLLGVSVATLKRHETGPVNQRVAHIYGGTLRVYWTSYPNGDRRYSRREIEALLSRRQLG